MRNPRVVAALSVLLTAAAIAARAEPMPAVPMLDQIVRSDHLVFEIVLGRITLIGGGLGARNTSATGSDRTETLQMRMPQNETQLHYQLSIPEETFSVTVSGPQAVQLERIPKGERSFATISYVQKPGRPVVFSVGSDEQARTIEAPSVWHLLLASPELCEEHLLPILGTLGPGWDLGPMVRAIEEGLLRSDSASALAERARWTALVGQLADDAFARREMADRELRAGGTGVIGFLRQLDFASLVPEQQYRIRRMIEAASSAGGDTAGEIVSWFSGDVRAWLILAGRADLATRETAAARLAEILREPVAFDPQADERDRARQIESLQQRLR